MKKIILLLVAVGAGVTAMAQVRGGDNFYAQKYVVDVNLPVGMLLQSPTSSINANNYLNVATSKISGLEMSAGASYGIDAEFGYFIGKRRKFGIGTGIWMSKQKNTATMNNFSVDYQSFDRVNNNGVTNNTFRQRVYSTQDAASPGSFKETLDITCINIPLVLKYKKRFSTRIGFTMDAGILYNLQMQNKWSSDAKFNYEAIYAYNVTGPDDYVVYYDNNPTPLSTDVLHTYDFIKKNNSIGTIASVFDSLRQGGRNVGLGIKPDQNSGTVSFKSGSIGFIIRPQVNVRLRDRIHLNLGAFFTYQTFNNNNDAGYKVIEANSAFTSFKYSSLLNSVSSVTNTTMGINIGVRYFIGTPKDSDFDGKFDE